MAEAQKSEKEDIYALEKPNGSPAYPKMIYVDTGEKYKDGAPVMKECGIAKNPDEHKKMLEEGNKAVSAASGAKPSSWPDKPKDK